MPTLQENIRYFRQQIRESFNRTLMNIHYYRRYCLEQAAIFARFSQRVANQALQACCDGAIFGYQLLRRFCVNCLDVITHIPHYLHQAFILTTEALRIAGQAFLSTLKPAARWIVNKAVLGTSQFIGFIIGAGAALGDLVVDGLRLLFGALPFGPRAAVAVGAFAIGTLGARRVIATTQPNQAPHTTSKLITPAYQNAKTSPVEAKNTPASSKKRLRKAA